MLMGCAHTHINFTDECVGHIQCKTGCKCINGKCFDPQKIKNNHE